MMIQCAMVYIEARKITKIIYKWWYMELWKSNVYDANLICFHGNIIYNWNMFQSWNSLELRLSMGWDHWYWRTGILIYDVSFYHGSLILTFARHMAPSIYVSLNIRDTNMIHVRVQLMVSPISIHLFWQWPNHASTQYVVYIKHEFIFYSVTYNIVSTAILGGHVE